MVTRQWTIALRDSSKFNLDYFFHRFKTIYRPKQQLSLDEGMIPWKGHLKFRTYNPAKITKYGLLIRLVCESDTGYICNMEIYTGERKKLEEIVGKNIRMTSTIHDTSVSNIGKKNRETGEDIVKHVCINQYNARMKGVDRADQYLSYYSILMKTMKWTKKVVLYLINCGLFNCFRIYNPLNPEKNKV